MPNPNMTYEQHLELFGTEEEIQKHKEHQAKFKEFFDSIPKVTIEDAMKALSCKAHSE